MSAGALPSRLPSIARRTIVKAWPTDPKNISFRRPIFSIRTMAAKEARKYSVPLHAAMIRDLTSENPRRSKRTVLIYDQTLRIRRKKFGSYSIVGDEVDTRYLVAPVISPHPDNRPEPYLLEALDGHTECYPSEVLAPPAREQLLEGCVLRGFSFSFDIQRGTLFQFNSFFDSKKYLLHLSVFGGFILKSRNNCHRTCWLTWFQKPEEMISG